MALLSPYSPKKLPLQPPPSWAFGSVCCFPSAVPCPRQAQTCVSLHVTTTCHSGRQLHPESGEQNKSQSLCQSLGESADRSKCKASVLKEQGPCWLSGTSKLHQECRLPSPQLLLPCWEMEGGMETSEKATVLSYQNSPAFFFIEQYPSNRKILD